MSNSSGRYDHSIGISIANSVRSVGNGGPFAGVNPKALCDSASAYTIEQHLESFSGSAPFDVLWSSWVLEKESLTKRLATIPLTFTTYTSHGADHSEVILSRIEELLGKDRIQLLSPTDAWLLLQCAYSHDIGMCVGENEKNALFDTIEKEPEVLRQHRTKRDTVA